MSTASTVVTVTTTATALSPTPGDQVPGSSAVLYNPGPATVYLGGANVTADTAATTGGHPLFSGERVSFNLTGSGRSTFTGDGYTNVSIDEVVYGRVASGTQAVNVLATGV